MRNGGGKTKGSSFERQVCVLLSRWLTNQTKDDVFWRSSISGGRSTVAAKKGKLLKNQVGDISAIDPIGHVFLDHFVIECKHLKNLGFEAAIKSNSGPLPKIWHKLSSEAYPHNKDGFLVMKQNNWPILLGLHPTIAIELTPIVTLPLIDLNIYYFDVWLRHINPKRYLDAFSVRGSSSE